jgi:hypothetical protein
LEKMEKEKVEGNEKELLDVAEHLEKLKLEE